MPPVGRPGVIESDAQLYGGGVEPGQPDLEMPIRAAVIRGQLRFWWRLLNRRDRSPEELFEKECAIWGGLSAQGATASRVVVEISEVNLKAHIGF